MSEKKRKLNISSKFLFTIGFIFVVIPLIFYVNQTVQLAFFTPKVEKVQKIASTPIAVSIPSVKIDLPIQETMIKDNVWSISPSGVSHLSTSARPTEKGSIILYAHNTYDRFGPIRQLTQGKEIILSTADGKKHTYIISKTFEVYPTQVEIFNQKEELLFLYTCSGFADLKRFIIVATPNTTSQN